MDPDRSSDTTTTYQKITTDNIKKCIKTKIKKNKAPGYDQITGVLLRELPLKGLQYLRNLYNSLLRLQYFPRLWKIAEVIAIPKPGKDSTIPSSYRPISLLPAMSKVFVKLLIDRLRPILDNKKTISDNQFGFRCIHSSVQQIHRVTHKILSDLDNKKFCIGVYLDIEKAFDKVWHNGLFWKLKRLLPKIYFQILKSYITERYFYVKVNDGSSTLRKIRAGIPQGSVLGPLLYTLFTSDIPAPEGEHTMLATFADDTVLLTSSKSISTATNDIQKSLDTISAYFKEWNIKINELKTQQVIYTTRRNFTSHKIKINGSDIPRNNAANYLGMQLDEKLTWKQHIKKKKTQMNLKLKQLYWLLNKNSKLSINNKVLIYNTIIKPIWTYGLQLWGTAKKTNLNIIQRQQSKILRLIVNAPWYITNNDIHQDLMVPTVEQQIKTTTRRHYSTLEKHSNNEVNLLPIKELTSKRRLQRNRPIDKL